MTNPIIVAQAAEQDPLSDEYVNAVIRKHGYGHPTAVAARLWQWIGLHGGENGVTLLMYEAHKALAKLRAPVAGEALYQIRRIDAGGWEDVDHERYEQEGANSIRGMGKRWQRRVVYAAPQASGAVRVVFPAHLRKMWSGGEVQAWLDEHQGITAPKPSAKGGLGRYREWHAILAQAQKDGAICSCPTGDGSLRWPCAVHPPPQADKDGAQSTSNRPESRACVESDGGALSAQPSAQKGGSDA